MATSGNGCLMAGADLHTDRFASLERTAHQVKVLCKWQLQLSPSQALRSEEDALETLTYIRPVCLLLQFFVTFFPQQHKRVRFADKLEEVLTQSLHQPELNAPSKKRKFLLESIADSDEEELESLSQLADVLASHL